MQSIHVEDLLLQSTLKIARERERESERKVTQFCDQGFKVTKMKNNVLIIELIAV